MEPNNNRKHFLTIAYIVADDAMTLMLVSAFALLIAESLIPGFISAHIPLAYFGIALLALIAITQTLTKALQIKHDITKKRHVVLFPFLLTLTFLLISNAMLKYPLWLNMIITLGMLATFYIIFTLFVFPLKK